MVSCLGSRLRLEARSFTGGDWDTAALPPGVHLSMYICPYIPAPCTPEHVHLSMYT